MNLKVVVPRQQTINRAVEKWVFEHRCRNATKDRDRITCRRACKPPLGMGCVAHPRWKKVWSVFNSAFGCEPCRASRRCWPLRMAGGQLCPRRTHTFTYLTRWTRMAYLFCCSTPSRLSKMHVKSSGSVPVRTARHISHTSLVKPYVGRYLRKGISLDTPHFVYIDATSLLDDSLLPLHEIIQQALPPPASQSDTQASALVIIDSVSMLQWCLSGTPAVSYTHLTLPTT